MAANLWFCYALGSAVMWGLGYTLCEKILRAGLSVPALMISINFCQILFFAIILLFQNNLSKNIDILKTDWTLLTLLMTCLVFAIGNFLVFQAFLLKSASHVNLVEISYPFFTIIFSVFLLKNFEMTLPAVMGGMLILSGVTLIYLKG